MPNWPQTATISLYVVYAHAIYWFASLLTVLISLAHGAKYAPQRRGAPPRRHGVFGIRRWLSHSGGWRERRASYFTKNWATDYIWLLTLCLPLSITYATPALQTCSIWASLCAARFTYGLLSALVLVGYVGVVWVANNVPGRFAHGVIAWLSRSSSPSPFCSS